MVLALFQFTSCIYGGSDSFIIYWSEKISGTCKHIICNKYMLSDICFFICRIALVLAFLMKLASGNYLYGNTFSLSLVSCCLVLANTFSTIFSNFISYYDYISAPFA
jgi:hypothetical protein